MSTNYLMLFTKPGFSFCIMNWLIQYLHTNSTFSPNPPFIAVIGNVELVPLCLGRNKLEDDIPILPGLGVAGITWIIGLLSNAMVFELCSVSSILNYSVHNSYI